MARPRHTLRPIQVGVIALYLFCAAVIGRALAFIYVELSAWFPWYFGLEIAFLLLFVTVMLRPGLPIWLLQAYFVVQSAIIVILVALPPHLDFITALFTMLSYQVALVLPGRSRWIWVGIFCALTPLSLVFWLGWLPGIAYSLTPIAGNLIFLTYVIANHEEQLADEHSQAVLSELQEKHHQLELRLSQVEQIASIEERNRLARELHESVSQMIFSIVLNADAAQILLDRQPAQVRSQLERLDNLTQDALSKMRSLIAQLRPKT
jgi:signal transduction histidine kinase